MSELDSIVETSLRSFYRDICSEWCGRENEAVNMYAFGHLAKHVLPGTILSELTQIGIEVAVRQLPLPKFAGKDRNVRKDLVIWPTGGMTLWRANIPHNEPLAVMEWKVNHYFNRAVHQKNRREHRGDIRWLRDSSLRAGMTGFTGYAVLVETTGQPRELHCVRIRNGKDEPMLDIPEQHTI